MNPELLKSVIGSVELKSNAGKFSENGDAMALNPSTLKHHECVFPPAFGGNTCGLGSLTTETTPLTIFYNGTVAVFDVPRPRKVAAEVSGEAQREAKLGVAFWLPGGWHQVIGPEINQILQTLKKKRRGSTYGKTGED